MLNKIQKWISQKRQTVSDVGNIQPNISIGIKPHYYGHRKRLRNRFLNSDIDALTDYEVLELLLFRAMPKRDVKPLAKKLIDRFGTFHAVIDATPERLMKVNGVGPIIATQIKLIDRVSKLYAQSVIKDQDIIASWGELLNYLRVSHQHNSIENVRLLLLNASNRLIRDVVISEGTTSQVQIYPREVLKLALDHDASAIILAHNHPSGDPRPSKQDVEITMELKQLLSTMSVALHDHLIIGANGIYSHIENKVINSF